jgi:magnesium-transporting ATPase (P-type)
MAGMLIVFAPQALYSGTPLFDEWLIAMLNFVAGLPIMVVGLFDRCLSKEYVKNNPVVYMASRRNELITVRTLLRWVSLVFVHIFILYYFTVPQLSFGGGSSSAFQGLMGNKNKDRSNPGNGEGGDIKSVGTVTFSCLIILLSYKVLYESSTLIHGVWPAFTCRKNVGEGFFSRVAYTWVTVGWLSLGFYLWAITVYSQLGRMGPSGFSQFTLMTDHLLTTRTINYMILIFIPVFAILVDVCGKLFSNMFYPTQTQIHKEIEAKQRREKSMQQVLRPSSFRRAMGMEEP